MIAFYPTLGLILGTSSLVLASAPSGPWDQFNYAPSSRTVWPTAVRTEQGSIVNSAKLVENAGSATLAANGSWLTLDYGKEVGLPCACINRTLIRCRLEVLSA